MAFGDVRLGALVCAGPASATSARVWARASTPGLHRLRIRPLRDDSITELAIDLSDPVRDYTGAVTVDSGIVPGRIHEVVLLRGDGQPVSRARFVAAPAGREDLPRRWSFAALSCHQPFGEDGQPTASARSMLAATRIALTEADVRFVLMMGDQCYADRPKRASLFGRDYFRTIAPPGRERMTDCNAAELRAIYQQRYRIFWGVPEISDLLSSFSSIPMIDDHEVVDNFGTHPDHATPVWDSVREGALDAAYDYQLSRVHPRRPDGKRPSTFDYSFRWGQAAVWGMDIRSQRRTHDGTTTVYSAQQWEAFGEFLASHGDAGLLVVMTPVPLVHVEGRLVNAASRLLGKGSDFHERWSHASCQRDRNRFVGMLLAHAERNPHQRILLLGGDVHSGAAFEIDFADGVQLLQLTSSPVSNAETWVVEKASEHAARTVSKIELPGGVVGRAGLLPGLRSLDDNPVGRLNVGIVDVIDHGERVGLRLRLIGHDDHGHPVPLFDSGEVGRTPEPERQAIGLRYL